MKLSTGPDMRWKVELSNGTVKEGARNTVLAEAVHAWKKDVQVVKWHAPGQLEINRKQRIALIQKDYENEISRLASKSGEE